MSLVYTRRNIEPEWNRDFHGECRGTVFIPGFAVKMRLHHIGIAVENIERALKIYSCAFGFELKEVLEMTNEGMKIAIIISNNLKLELIEPLREDTPVGKFMKKRGSGIHHICFSVPKLETTIRDLERKGLSLVAPPRSGAKGEKVVFFHPKSTMGVLIEICEEREE